jgi:hypothetical protein
MAVIEVTAKITLQYDTEDGLVTDIDEGLLDMQEYIASGPSVGDFTYDARWVEEV